MHAHDRTMLARLGFADPDRREPLHDQACRYLTTPSAIQRIINLLGLEYAQRAQRFEYSAGLEHRCVSDRVVTSHQAALEREVSRGCDQYRTTIGFIDVHCRFELTRRHTQVEQRRSRLKLSRDSWTSREDYLERERGEAAIEVKITETPIGDVMRQINLYRAYTRISTWILATTYPLTQSQVDCLSSERIGHVVLGVKFREYVAQQESAAPATSVEV